MGAKVRVVDYSHDEHKEMLLTNIRDMDKRELYLLMRLQPRPAFEMTVGASVRTWAGFVDDDLVCVFGINRRSAISDVGIPWLVGTNAVEKIPLAFLKQSRKYFELFERAFPQMENYVYADNRVVIRWLEWLGFDMDEPQPMGGAQAPFIRFSKGFGNVL